MVKARGLFGLGVRGLGCLVQFLSCFSGVFGVEGFLFIVLGSGFGVFDVGGFRLSVGIVFSFNSTGFPSAYGPRYRGSVSLPSGSEKMPL